MSAAVFIAFAAMILAGLRPKAIPEWVWPIACAALLLVLGFEPAASALRAIAAQWNVLLFILGLMGISAGAECSGLFAVRAALGAADAGGTGAQPPRLPLAFSQPGPREVSGRAGARSSSTRKADARRHARRRRRVRRSAARGLAAGSGRAGRRTRGADGRRGRAAADRRADRVVATLWPRRAVPRSRSCWRPDIAAASDRVPSVTSRASRSITRAGQCSWCALHEAAVDGP